MTITLTQPYSTYAAGASVDLDNATEASLVAQGRALYTINPGAYFAPLTATEQQSVRDNGAATAGNAMLTIAQAAAVQALVSTAQNDRGLLLVGGDHPYAQWDNNGMLQCYLDNGLKPYIAVNSGAGSPAPGETDTMTWARLAALNGTSFEVCSHGARHIQQWYRLNTGIRIQYSGVAAAPTVAIDGSGVTLVGNGGGENATLTFATYTTLATMAAAISAQGAGVWSATVASELTGSEAAGNLLYVAARNVKSSTNNQYFAAGGGIAIRYIGTAYETVWIHRTTAPSLDIYFDGVRLINFALSSGTYNTITKLVTQINAAGISGLTAYIMDNGRAENASWLSYVQGDEDSQNIKPGQYDCVWTRACIDAGLTRWYMIDRQMQSVSDTAASYGITMRHFAQSGDGFYQNLTDHAQYESFRGNADARTVSPFPVPLSLHDARFNILQTTQDNSNVPWTAAQYEAVVDALGDSGPFMVNLMCHKVLPDGTSKYVFTNPDSYYNMTEANFVAAIQYAGAAVTAGSIDCEYPTISHRQRNRARTPRNLIFNPKFRNDGSSLLNANDSGFKIPGWYLITSNSIFSAVSVASGVFTATTTSATSTPFLYNEMILEPGATYELSVQVDVSTFTSGNGLRLAINAKRGKIHPYTVNNAVTELGQRVIGSAALNGARSQRITMRFTVPNNFDWMAAKVVGNNSSPYNLTSTPADVKINLDSKGQLNVNCAGATPAATNADEVAAALNAAIAGSPSYPAEYRNCAKVVAGKVVVTNPYSSSDERLDSGFGVQLDAGTSNSATGLIFGSSQCRAVGRWEAYADAGEFPWYFVIYSEIVGTFSLSAPSVRKLQSV